MGRLMVFRRVVLELLFLFLLCSFVCFSFHIVDCWIWYYFVVRVFISETRVHSRLLTVANKCVMPAK